MKRSPRAESSEALMMAARWEGWKAEVVLGVVLGVGVGVGVGWVENVLVGVVVAVMVVVVDVLRSQAE